MMKWTEKLNIVNFHLLCGAVGMDSRIPVFAVLIRKSTKY